MTPSAGAGRPHNEGTLASGLYWQSWEADAPVGVVVVVHGAHEHSGRYRHVAERLTAAGYTVYAFDLPGHGHSPGRRGNIDRMATVVRGVDEVTRMAGDSHPDAPLFIYGHSLGGLIVLQYLTGSPDQRLRGAVVSAPALDTSTATAVQRMIAPVVSALLPNLGIVPLDPEAVSRDPAVVQAYRTDPLNYLGKMGARTGSELMLTAHGMPARLPRITMPLLVLHGGADRLMPSRASAVVRDHAGSSDITVHIYEGLYHEPHNEPEKEQVLGEIVAWLDAHR